MAGMPVAVDVQNYLTAAGLLGGASGPNATQEALLDYSGALAAAIEEFERRTGYRPFLSTGTDETRVFDGPNGNTLEIAGGLVAAPTSLKVNGMAYTLNSSYFLLPQNAAARGLPYTAVRFGTRALQDYYYEGVHGSYLGTGLRLIEIVGKWGYALTNVPEDVRQAIIRRAASNLMGQVMTLKTQGGLLSWKEADVSEDYGIEAREWIEKQMISAFEQVVKRYRIVPDFRSVRVAAA